MSNSELSKPINTQPTITGQEQFIRVPANYEVIVEHPGQGGSEATGDLLQLLWRRRWIVLIVFLLCMAGVAGLAMKTPPVYTATARMRVGVKTPQVQPFAVAPERNTRDHENPMATHIEIFKSPVIAERVVRELNYNPTQFRETGMLASLRKIVNGNAAEGVNPDPAAATAAQGADAAEDRQKQQRVSAFLRGLSVSAIPDTQMFEARYTSSDPQFSAQALNALCENYVAYDFESKANVYAEAQRWLQEQLNQSKEKLAQSEQALFSSAGGDGAQYLTMASNAQDQLAQMEELRLKIVAAEDEYRRKKVDFEKIQAGGFPDEMISKGGNMVLDQLRTQLAAAEVDYVRTRQVLGPKDDRYKESHAAREQLAAQLAAEKNRILRNAEVEANDAKSRLDDIKAAYAAKQDQIIDLQQHLSDYNIVKRDVDVNREMYNNLVQKWREVSVAQSIQPSDVTVLQRAGVPLGANPQGRNRTLLIGLLLSAALSIGIAMLPGGKDPLLNDSGDIWRTARLKTLGHVGRLGPGSLKNSPALLAAPGASETFRSLRMTLQDAYGGGTARVLMLASSKRGEGKTLIASNLAISFARRGRNILLIDANIDRPELHKIFGIENTNGLTELLASEGQPEKDSVLAGGFACASTIANLHVMPAGSSLPNATDLLDSPRLNEILRALSTQYDSIIIDAPAVSESIDARIMASEVDGVLMVVNQDKVRHSDLATAVADLDAVGALILGCVINKPSRRGTPKPDAKVLSTRRVRALRDPRLIASERRTQVSAEVAAVPADVPPVPEIRMDGSVPRTAIDGKAGSISV